MATITKTNGDDHFCSEDCGSQPTVKIVFEYSMIRLCNKHAQQLVIRLAKRVGGLP